MSRRSPSFALTAIAGAVAACSGRPSSTISPVVAGPVEIRVAYPKISDTTAMLGDTVLFRAAENQVFPNVDSVFVFGTVGRGDATVRVNGRPVEVHPSGGWIAWLPLEADSIAFFDIEARGVAGDRRFARLTVPVVQSFKPPAAGPWIDTTSFSPRGDMWVKRDEGYALAVRADSRARVDLVFPDSSVVPMLGVASMGDRNPGALAFGTNDLPDSPEVHVFRLFWQGAFGPDPGPILAPADTTPVMDSSWVMVRAIDGVDTVTARWPLRLRELDPFPPVVAYLDDERDGTGGTDGTTPGRPSFAGTYHWFFPNGTESRISGRRNSRVRLQLSGRTVSWVSASELVGLPPGTPPPVGTTNPIRLTPGERSAVLRFPLDRRYPFRVDEDGNRLTVTLYGLAADMDWLQYGGTDPLVTRMSFEQPVSDEVAVHIDLDQDVWGYRTRWEGSTLALEIRRPPVLRRNVFSGIRVAVDAGHPPAGSTGPTLVHESEVTLAVARRLARMLRDRGADAIMIRSDSNPMGLSARTRAAEDADADILISVHANALPDGVNPFENNGTSVYYYQPRSARLARELDRALVREFGSRDLGFGRADLALARPTWMPAALTEGLFMMLPDQEAVLTSETGQESYARGIMRGIEGFLRFRRSMAGR